MSPLLCSELPHRFIISLIIVTDYNHLHVTLSSTKQKYTFVFLNYTIVFRVALSIFVLVFPSLCVFVYVWACVCVCICVYVFVCVCVFVGMYVCMCVRGNVCTVRVYL